MNHKRGRAKNRRAGCLMCKPHKMNGARKDLSLDKNGFNNLRNQYHTERDLKENYNGKDSEATFN